MSPSNMDRRLDRDTWWDLQYGHQGFQSIVKCPTALAKLIWRTHAKLLGNLFRVGFAICKFSRSSRSEVAAKNEMCARHHAAWVHIDGAIGLWAAGSPRYRHLVKGIEAADSWATDGHKWLNLPFDCGYAFVADSESHRASMAYRADYLTYASDARDQCDWNPEWSRSARGFPTYAALRQLGTAGVSALVERCCQHCYALVTRIGSLPGAEILWTPQINQGLVGFLSPLSGASMEDHDRWTDQVIAEIAFCRRCPPPRGTCASTDEC